MVGAGLVDRGGQQAGVDRRADQQLQRIDVLRDVGALEGEIGLRLRQDFLRLAEIGPRRDAALEPQSVKRTLFSAAAAVCCETSSRLRSAA